MWARWTFTLNNPSPEEEAHIVSQAQTEHVKYLVFGRETGDSGTPHLQGFVILDRSQRLAYIRGLISARAHFERARGTNDQASNYCKKDGDFEEFGTLESSQGRRTDWDSFKAWVVEQPTKPTASLVANQFPGLFVKHARIMVLIDLIYPVNPRIDGELRAWQRHLEADLLAPPDDRKIIFVVDPEGGNGKSWFVKYWLTKQPQLTQCLSIGKRDDLAFSIDESKQYFLFDIPRSCGEFLQYPVLEKLKDGVIYSPKYGSRTKYFSTNVHVVVFMNEEPDLTKLTRDRYVTLEISY